MAGESVTARESACRNDGRMGTREKTKGRRAIP
jgi:hypothetical protein